MAGYTRGETGRHLRLKPDQAPPVNRCVAAYREELSHGRKPTRSVLALKKKPKTDIVLTKKVTPQSYRSRQSQGSDEHY